MKIPTGIESLLQNNISIYPNPTKGKLFVQSDMSLQKISIKDLSGKSLMVRDANSFEAELDISLLSNGVYLMEIIGENGVKTVNKIVKN